MKYFVEYNNNPKHKKTGDCVVRALSQFMHADWKLTYQDLCNIGLNKGVMPNNPDAYKTYLAKVGIEMQKQPKNSLGKRMTLKEFLEQHPKGEYLLHVRKHLTYCRDGICYDTWDCTDYCVGNYWKI